LANGVLANLNETTLVVEKLHGCGVAAGVEGGAGEIGRLERIGVESVLDVGEKQLLVLFLVIEAEKDATQRFSGRIACEKAFDALVNMMTIRENFAGAGAREGGSEVLIGKLGEGLVVAVEEPGEVGIEELVVREKFTEDEGLEEPSGMGEMPLGGRGFGAGLYHHVLGGERLAQAQTGAPHATKKLVDRKTVEDCRRGGFGQGGSCHSYQLLKGYLPETSAGAASMARNVALDAVGSSTYSRKFFMTANRRFLALSLGPWVAVLGLGLGLASGYSLQAQAAQDSGQGDQGGGRRGGGMRSMGDFPGGGRGVVGTVTAVTADHYTIKGEDGAVYTVHYSVNTRIVKGGAGRRWQGGQRGQGRGNEAGEGERQPPQPLKPADIKVGDVITAGGEMDAAAKSIGAVFIVQIDPERVKEMREMQANYGKTWLAGKVIKVEGTTITIEGMVDHAPHAIEVDENTSFRRRRESVTLADIQPGMQLRAEGGVKGEGFLATTVTAAEPRGDRGPGGQSGPTVPASAAPLPPGE
jgi:hypothetical protein